VDADRAGPRRTRAEDRSAGADTGAPKASATLGRLGYANIKTKIGDGYQGWPTYAPFDAIVVTAAPDHVPAAWLNVEA
jgi:protein-L-isoaspartate O-methyltransferase